ncbi:hypothetical protein phiCTC2A_66 (endogenous virus) [Clostridium phage phiCTC2A]|uniref:Restriction endonuclease type IV Mrr domain-containing protein n=1 Tax=Clostridium tetani (strain Massachusetts / E88) TaxID=212717 RepID=Q895Z6_CLOTE|nr:hypothetical protein [Clostridium tetani]YP_009219442.1 hypothetical protein phiCT9441A_77 [Clostridium phage phiCT9441A]YP_009277273.1 hypothetical protein phiCTC2A_66 [Clostridium phage phiCTC2A]YP_009277340.1 hypothetical protein phiCT19406A_66 [Clostridium phage phiCT19406A]AAO35694.1 hypothetical protein CTC_01115 [Clostridium tetani E88]AJA42689.1 hypothetical protein phiCT9441A_77 [Clostridium phage phiCT9441A]AJA42756.1 hypothetical protein phiCT19406A_66 [Clostridium phage phiCT19
MSEEKYKFQECEYLLDKFEDFNKDAPDILAKVLQKRSGINSEEFNELYKLLINMHSNEEKYKGVKAKTKGNILEKIIELITIKTKLFKLFTNVSNNSNEYDIIITPSELATMSYNALPEIIYQPIICECKNYKKPVDVTWIGKFYMLLSISNIKCGIIFSYEGITSGKGAGKDKGQNDSEEWNNAKGLIKKIFLKDGIVIIDISKKELDSIKNGKRLYDIIQSKYADLMFMTNIEKYKIEHISSEKIKEIIEDVNEQVEFYESKKFKK